MSLSQAPWRGSLRVVLLSIDIGDPVLYYCGVIHVLGLRRVGEKA